MKNVSYSTLLFSAFSPKVLLSPVKNKINPINSSARNIIKNKIKNNEKLFMNSSNLNISNINKNNTIQRKNFNTFYINNKNSFSKKHKILFSFYSGHPFKNKKKLVNTIKFTKDFIIMRPQRIKSANTSLQKINNKNKKSFVEPYKKYLFEKNKIELNRKEKEREMNYIIESKRQQKLKMENDLRKKFQGLDFSRQKRREFFIEKLLKTKQYTKKIEKCKNNEEENNINKQINYQYLKERLNFEVNERKYMFLENNEFFPKARYASFNQKLRFFLRNIKENPNLNLLVNYISKNK